MPRLESLALHVLPAVLALPHLLTACDAGDASTPGAVETEVREENGITRVSNAGAPPRWEAEPLLRIGALEGTGADVFGQVRSVVADAEGNVYVADGQAREIRVFGADGAHLRTLGREGAGPGEFRNLVGLAWLGDALAAKDPGNGRIQLLSPAGEDAGTRPATSATGSAGIFHPRRVGDAEFWVPDFVVGGGGGLQSVFVRHTAEGAVDTVPALERPENAPPGGVLCRGEGFITSFRFASASQLVFGFAPDRGRLASWTDAYRFALLDATGDTVRTVSWLRDPVPIDDDAWEEETAEFRGFQQARRTADCDPASPHRPSHHATLRHLSTDDAGRLWVESYTPEGYVWDVFDGDGRWLAEVRLPERQEVVPPYIRDGVLYQVETDDFDVQYVTAYRISPL